MARVLTESDVRALLPMRDLIDSMRTALEQYSAGRAQQPVRTVLDVGAARNYFGVMPAVLSAPAAAGAKLVTVFGGNRSIGLPSHLATIVLFDPGTGGLLGILDGRYITGARTGAVSAVATDLLARADATTLAMVGSGVQARSHLEAIACVRSLREVRVWSPTSARRDAFVHEMQPHTPARIRAVGSARQAVQGADLVVLATASKTPVVLDDWIGDGAHICAVGACRPADREMDARLVARARTFVDSRAGALAEAGDIVLAMEEHVIARDHIAGELGELIAGRVPGRQGERQVTLFKSLGMAVEDVAAAHLALSRALVRGLGTEIEL